MTFAIITKDAEGSATTRATHQDAHKRYLDHNRAHLVVAGAMLQDDGATAHGRILLVEFETQEEVETFLREDPFWDTGVFGDITISRWRKAVVNGKLIGT